MLEKMVIIVIAFFIFLTYHQHTLICAWSAFLLSAIFMLHQIYYVLKNPTTAKHIDLHISQSSQRTTEANPGQYFQKIEGSGGFMKLKDSLKLHHDYWWPQKDRKRRMAKIIKLMRDFLLVIIYVIWVFAILNLVSWQASKCSKNTAKCRKLNKNSGINIQSIFTSQIPIQNFIYFIPLMISCCWKSYVILQSKKSVDDQILVIEEFIDLQCKSQIFIAFYYIIDKAIHYFYNIYFFWDNKKDNPNDSIHIIGCTLLIIAYLGIKYGWSLGMRISFWKTHLLLDFVFKRLGNKARASYHYFLYGWISKLAYKPLKHKYQRKYGLYFDLL